MTTFFEEPTESSKVKAKIVSSYFDAWSKIIKKRAPKLAYIDLFAGPGRYEDGSKSTPLKVLETAINDENLRERLVAVFNDANSDFASNLENQINQIENINMLKYKPTVINEEVGEELAEYFHSNRLVPTLGFVDPWGYKGLSSKLIGALTKDWGSDCIFFFNYNRINMGITNDIVKEHMNSIFGEERAAALRERVAYMSPEERELTIVNELSESLSLDRKNYVLPFRFIREDGTRTSHYLIFVSKHELGYTIMKEIMWHSSSDYDDGVASFSFIPVKREYRQLELLLGYATPLEKLGDELLEQFSGQSIRMIDIFHRHHIGRPFIGANYKEILRRLEEEGKIVVNPPASKRPSRKGVKTFGDNVVVNFLS